MVVLSSTKAEYRVVSQVSEKIVWTTCLLSETKISRFYVLIILSDNISTGSLGSNAMFQNQNKHITIKLSISRTICTLLENR